MKMKKLIFSRVKRSATAKIMLLAASITLAVLLASCAAQKAGTGPTTKPTSHTHNGKIAFSRLDNRGQSDLFVMKADGTGLERLATKPVGDSPNPSPAWSPNGKRLAFDAESRGGNSEFNIDIYVMNADGSGLKRITQEPTFDSNAGWIYTVNSDGSGSKKLTAPHKGLWDSQPSWSPDGTRIAFTRSSARRADVFTMNADGTHVRKLTGKTDGFLPDFSPDGNKIVFVSNDEGQTIHIHVMNADGADVRRLTKKTKVHDDAPDWQPLP